MHFDRGTFGLAFGPIPKIVQTNLAMGVVESIQGIEMSFVGFGSLRFPVFLWRYGKERFEKQLCDFFANKLMSLNGWVDMIDQDFISDDGFVRKDR